MVEGTVKTGVDELIELLKHKNKITITDAAKELKITAKVLQKWVDFLIEEKIIGVEYKFTVPYIYLNRTEEETQKVKEEVSLQTIKRDFYERAKKDNLSKTEINKLWQTKLTKETNNQKKYFFKLAQSKKLQNIQVLWTEFFNKTLSFDKQIKIQ